MVSFPKVCHPLNRVVIGALLVFGSVSVMHAQCAPLRADLPGAARRNTPHEPILPESGYLSNSTYINVFFGFALDLPIPAQGNLVKLPLMPERQHALLAIAHQDGDRTGSLTIDAIEPREGLEGFSAKQQQQKLNARSPGTVQTGAQSEPQLQPGPGGTLAAPQPRLASPQFQFPAGRFHSSERHTGEKYTATYWMEIKGYRVGVLVATNDKVFLQKARQAMSGVRFYCTADDGTLATKQGDPVTPEGELYEGPTVPTWLADVAIQTNRGLAIPPGEIAEGVYRNPALGLQYELPQGWETLPTHNGGNPPADPSSLREFEFLHACSRTLLRIRHPVSSDTGGASHQPMIVLRALDPACLALRTPVALSDTRAAEEVGVSLETLQEFGQVASHELVSVSGHLFLVFHGTIAAPAEGEQLAQRMSQTIFATNYNKMLLVWSFMAPTAGELATMPAGGIRLDGSEPIDLRLAVAANR